MNVTKFFEIHIIYPPVKDPETGNLTGESPRPALKVGSRKAAQSTKTHNEGN